MLSYQNRDIGCAWTIAPFFKCTPSKQLYKHNLLSLVVLEQSGEKLVQYEKCITYFSRFNHCSAETEHLIISSANDSTCMAYIKHNCNIWVGNRVRIIPTPPQKHQNYASIAVDFPTFCSQFLKWNYQQQLALRCSCHSVHWWPFSVSLLQLQYQQN